MKLIVLYGPPGVGKLTVAKELAPRIGAQVFHNHVVIDAVEPIITRQHPRFTPIVYSLQRQILTAALEAKAVDIIFTFAFSLDEREGVELLDSLIAAGGEYGVEVMLVHLTCDHASLRRRIAENSRRTHGKLTDVAHLDEMLRRYDLFSPHPHPAQLRIDTTDLAPAETAARIAAAICPDRRS
jgi:broad-specificity NMP kinase